MIITQNGEAKVVVQDIKSYERDRDTLLMLKLLAQGVAESERDETMEQAAFFNKLEKKLSKA